MSSLSGEFFASALGGPQFRVLARFVMDEHGLHVERLDQTQRRWVIDGTVAGYRTGHDDWARPITRLDAEQLLARWGLDPSLLDAPVV
jgi:hypothetical protein